MPTATGFPFAVRDRHPGLDIPIVANPTFTGVGVGGTVAFGGFGPSRQDIIVANAALSYTNAAGVTFATIKICDLPTNCAVQIEAIAADLTINGGAGIPAGATNVALAIGTAATADSTLNGNEVNLVASSNVTLASSVGTYRPLVAAAGLLVDGRTTTGELHLNMAVPTGVTGNGVLTVTGNIILTYKIVGRNGLTVFPNSRV